jgi:hypothetical protein
MGATIAAMKTDVSFHVQPLSAEFADRVRSSLCDDFGRQVRATAAAGGEPLRDQLRRATPGEPIILCSYQAVALPSTYAEIGPIFISALAGTQPQPVLDGLPDGYFTRCFALRGYDASHRILEATLTELVDAVETIRRLLSLPGCLSVHARFAGHGCFAARILRE